MTYSQALANLETISDEIHRNRQCQDLGVRGIGVGADSPLPPPEVMEGGPPLTTQPLHYAEGSPDAGDSQEFMSLPGKLGPSAAPILASVATRAAVSSTSHSSMPAVPDGCVGGGEGEGGVEIEKRCGLREESGEVIVEEVDGGATSTDLTGWQVVGLSNPPQVHHLLTVDDRDSTVSDTESLASIEMLSDEAIASLMLDEELAQASTSMYSTTTSTPVVDPPLPGTSSIHFLPTFFHSSIGGGQCVGSAVEGGQGDGNCCGITNSLMGLKLDSPGPGNRQHHPPNSLSLTQQDSSSEHSSPEDLTPGYAPLRDTPGSPDDYLPLSHTQDEAASPSSASTSEEAQEPHCSSWVLENTPVVQK